MDTSSEQGEERIHWAQKVSRTGIRRLYETGALGIVDVEVIDDAGAALYGRCEGSLLLSRAGARCPRCGGNCTVGFGCCEDEAIECPARGCGWRSAVRYWHNTGRRQGLIGVGAASAFEEFVEEFWRGPDPRTGMALIGQLIQAFHRRPFAETRHRSAANNLIEGNYGEAVTFPDGLTYGEDSTRGLRASREQWRQPYHESGRLRRPIQRD